MLQVEHLLVATVRARMPRDAPLPLLVPQLQGRRPELDLDGGAERQQPSTRWAAPARDRPVHARSSPRPGRTLAARQQQVLTLDRQRLTHRPAAPAEHATFLGAAGGQV